MLFATAATIGSMLSANGAQLDLMGTYDWLFTAEEQKQAKIARLTAVLESKR